MNETIDILWANLWWLLPYTMLVFFLGAGAMALICRMVKDDNCKR